MVTSEQQRRINLAGAREVLAAIRASSTSAPPKVSGQDDERPCPTCGATHTNQQRAA